ncbi:MAG: hypothetical protein FJ041_02180 [Candidatus Cloacimonetes bacterium]|nr:hypothetical protein [Candidatus Cloacimonadota bacterium]
MKSKSFLTALLLALLIVTSFAYQNSLLSLISPTELGDRDAEVSIAHRFKGKVDDKPLDTFFGMNDKGANVGLFYRQAILYNAELKLGYITNNREYLADASWRFTPADFPVQAQVDIEYFSFEELDLLTNKLNRKKNFLTLLAIQNKPLLERIYLNANVGYELEKKRTVAGFGIGIKTLDKLTVIGEFYPDSYKTTALRDTENFQRTEDSFAIGIKADTYGHHFMLVLGNNDALTLRKNTYGSADKNWKLGFNIQRYFDF